MYDLGKNLVELNIIIVLFIQLLHCLNLVRLFYLSKMETYTCTHIHHVG